MVIYTGPQLALPYAGLCVCVCKGEIYDGNMAMVKPFCVNVHEHLKQHKDSWFASVLIVPQWA